MKRAAFILAFAAAAQAAWASQVPSDAEIRRILAERLKGFEQSVSIVVGVIEPEGRRVVSYGSMGMSDPRPVDGDTLYEIGSITKPFTALILADMVERNEVKLDDPVEMYLPAGVKVPERGGKKVTLLEISTHRSALPRMPSQFDARDPMNPYPSYPVERMYEFLSGHQLRRDIGAEYEYSNLAFGLLGHALARRAGTDYEGLIRERILQPLGMTSTFAVVPPELRARFAEGHSSNYRLAPTPHWEFTDAFAGAGALRSTANDMLTFLAANLGYTQTPLAPAMAAMRQPRRDVSENLKIGLAWRIQSFQQGDLVHHGGATYGFRTFLGFDPVNRTGVVVLSNYQGGSGIDDIGLHLLNPRLDLDRGSGVRPRDRTAVTLDPKFLDLYAGRYRFENGDVWTVRRDGSRFFLTKPGEPEFEIFPEGDFEKGNDDFFAKHLDALFTFDFDKDAPGRASELVFNWSFLDPQRARRIE